MAEVVANLELDGIGSNLPTLIVQPYFAQMLDQG
jgi:hypothetical protein